MDNMDITYFMIIEKIQKIDERHLFCSKRKQQIFTTYVTKDLKKKICKIIDKPVDIVLIYH